jgi:AraC-like DNA-binding protein
MVEARAQLLTAREGDFVVATRLVIKSNRSDKWLRIAEAAKLANLSVRSFQRKLASSGMTYKDMVDQVRAEVAVEMLKEREMTLTEISTALEYSTVSNFARAFERWMGQAPTEFRRAL